MKKGQQVRILRTNEIGIIADVDIIRLHGRPQKRYEVRTRPGQEGWWYKPDQLGSVIEKVRCTIKGEQPGEIHIDFELDYREGKENRVTLSALPDLSAHDGTIAMGLVSAICRGLWGMRNN